MLRYCRGAALLGNFEYCRLFSLIDSGTDPDVKKIKTQTAVAAKQIFSIGLNILFSESGSTAFVYRWIFNLST